MTNPGPANSANPEPSPGDQDRAGEIGQDLYCQGCGYNLRGLTGDRCPECGHSLETIRSARTRIPWVYRKEQGWFRAYWRTVWLVMFRQRLFCEEMARPVSYADAQRFRWVTILHVYVPFLIATVVYCVAEYVSPAPVVRGSAARMSADLLRMVITAVWPIAVIHVAVLLYLAAVTGVPSYFFHPKGLRIDLQNRAIALSYYASGALAISAFPVAAGVASYFLDSDSDLSLFFALVAVTVPLGQLIAWFLDLTHICRRIMPQFERRVLLIGTCVPLLWLVLSGIILVGIPTVALYIVAIVVTLA